jgi:hypothetical protein
MTLRLAALEMTAAILFGTVALLTWAVLLRPVPRRSVVGTITGKTFKAAGTYAQYPAGAGRGFRAASEIPIAEAYVFEIKVDGMAEPVRYALNAVASKEFEVGQRVQIEYQERSFPVLWRRVYVVDMRPAVQQLP